MSKLFFAWVVLGLVLLGIGRVTQAGEANGAPARHASHLPSRG